MKLAEKRNGQEGDDCQDDRQDRQPHADDPDRPADIEALRAYLENKKVTRCDVPTWKLFGLSMTVYNLIASTALFGFSALMLWLGRCRKTA